MLKIKNLKSNNRNLSGGFTIVEMLVALSVFSLMVITISSVFVRAVALERRTVATQRIQENATLIIESMAKEIRVSRIEDQDSSDCSAEMLTMVHPIYGAVSYTLQEGNVLRQGVFDSFINSSDVMITRMNFCITGSSPNDNESAKVSIILAIQNVKGVITTVNLQTTVVSRDIDSELQN